MLRIGLVDVPLVKPASVPSYVKFASPAMALAPVTVTTVLSVDPVNDAALVTAPISDAT